MAATQVIDANDKKFIGINRLARPDHIVPPSGAFWFICINARDMMVA